MGEAKRRKTEIEALKAKGPPERKNRKLRLKVVRTDNVFHFKSEACRRAADPEHKLDLSNVVQGVDNGTIEHKHVHPVAFKAATFIPERLPREPKPLQQVRLVTGRKLTDEEFFTHALALAQINPQGFRQPSAKAKNYKSTSLIEQLSLRMGIGEQRVAPDRSERGQKKLTAQNECKARIMLDRLIEQHPDRAAQAKADAKKTGWFVAKVYEGINAAVDREWLTDLVKERVKSGVNPKYQHKARRWRDNTKKIEALMQAAA